MTADLPVDRADDEGSPDDAPAFDAFVADVEGRVRRALTAVAGPEAARDATTDALVHAWRQWPRVAAMANPAGYVYTVARSRLRRPGAPPLAGPLPDGLADPTAFPEVEPALARSLAALPERQRTCVYLLHGCGWSTPEVADLLDVSVSTVRNHVARALDHLRRDLGVDRDDPDPHAPAGRADAGATGDPATGPGSGATAGEHATDGSGTAAHPTRDPATDPRATRRPPGDSAGTPDPTIDASTPADSTTTGPRSDARPTAPPPTASEDGAQ